MTRRTLLTLFSALGAAPAVVSAQGKPGVTYKVSFTDAEWKQRLGPAAYDVLRHEGTERPFTSALNNEKRKGTYHCAGCDAALFTANMKFDSGTGWPSFYTTLPGVLRRDRRPQAVHGAHRVPLRHLRRAPWSCLQRRAGAHRQALLQQRRGTEVRGGRMNGAPHLSARRCPGVRAGGAGPLGRGPGHGQGHLRRWLLLVRGGRFRQAAGRAVHHLGLHRRQGREPELRAGDNQDHRPCRGGGNRLRPGQGELRAAARTLLAHHRPDHPGPPVLRQRLALPHAPSSPSMRRS